MRNEQLDVLEKFRNLYGEPTYKEMTVITGMQLTRVFRLYNGFEMKLSEYLCFKRLVDDKIKEDSNIKFIFNECLNRLPIVALQNIEMICHRHLEMFDLVNDTKIQEIVA